jgi:hypothetical protein
MEEDDMASKRDSNRFPPLTTPDPKIADPGKVRLGDSMITAEFPPLSPPDPKVADPAKVRLGDSMIAARFPLKK